MTTQPSPQKPSPLRLLLIALGLLCFGLGTAGIFLPLLPTTPLYLAAAFCFARSSERLSAWFRGTRLYQSHLETLRQGEGMTWPAKIRILTTVTLLMGFAGFSMVRAYQTKGSKGALFGAILLAFVWAAHLIAFCFVIKTCPRDKARDLTRKKEDKP